jgi:hypothetical protein
MILLDFKKLSWGGSLGYPEDPLAKGKVWAALIKFHISCKSF